MFLLCKTSLGVDLDLDLYFVKLFSPISFLYCCDARVNLPRMSPSPSPSSMVFTVGRSWRDCSHRLMVSKMAEACAFVRRVISGYANTAATYDP